MQDAKKRSLANNNKQNDDSKSKEKHWCDAMKCEINTNNQPINAEAIILDNLDYPRICIMVYNNQIKTTK